MRFLVVVCIACCGTVAARADSPPQPREDITLKNVRWQPLPSGISQVIIGPDGRTWFQRSSVDPRRPIEQVKQDLTVEFTQRAPQIRHARLLLLEPQGRAWFVAGRPAQLLAYDGKEWVSKELVQRTEYPTGHTPTRGRLIDGRTHRYAGGTAWLMTTRGVHRFDGKTWTNLEFPSTASGRVGEVLLCVSHDGGLAVAQTRELPSIWVFREGQWREQKLAGKEQRGSLISLVATDSRTLLVRAVQGNLSKVAVDPGGQLSPPVDVNEFGPFKVAEVRELYQDERGRIYIVAGKIDGGEAQSTSGVVILEPGGNARLLHGPDLAMSWLPRYGGFPPAILAASGEQAWLPNRFTAKAPALFDFVRGDIVNQLPDDGFGCLHAVNAAGRVYVARNNLGMDGQLIMVYTPGAAGNPTLTPKRISIGDGPFVVEDSGAVWTYETSKNFVRIADDDRTTVPYDAPFGSRTLLVGQGNVVLIAGGERTALYRDGKEVAVGGLFELLEDHRELFCQAFGPANPPSPNAQPVMVSADTKGRLWCLQNRSLWVLVGNRWHDAHDALIQAGSRHGLVEYLAAIGDGRRIYVSDLMLRHDGGRSFIGELSNDAPKFVETEHLLRLTRGCYALRDQTGALWLRATDARSAGTSDLIVGQLATRLLPSGGHETLRDAGWPTFVDRSGNVWLEEVRGKPQDMFRIWRKGRLYRNFTCRPTNRGGCCSPIASGRCMSARPPDCSSLSGLGPW